MKRTPWIPSTMKPVRGGVYECRFRLSCGGHTKTVKRVFKGGRWYWPALGMESSFGGFAGDQWRGLTEKH
jgi:hypothetical protein